jgi:putative membrane protein
MVVTGTTEKRGSIIDWQQRYCGPAPVPANWADQWNGDPVLIAAMLLAGGLMAWRLSGPRRQAGLLSLAVLVLAFVSPLCALTTALFAARAVHHLLLFTLAAPLLAIAFPAPWLGKRVPAVLLASTVMLWAWHWPVAYDAALGNVALYWVMQIGLLAAGWAFWTAVGTASPAPAVTGIVGGAVQMGFLGALLTFATRPLYAVHATSTVPFGIGPIADQQLAGLIMWVPGMLPYAAAIGWIAHRNWRQMTQTGAAT